MLPNSALEMHTWVGIGGEVDIDYTICGGEVEFTIGGADGLVLHTTTDGLKTLHHQVQAAVQAAHQALAGTGQSPENQHLRVLQPPKLDSAQTPTQPRPASHIHRPLKPWI